MRSLALVSAVLFGFAATTATADHLDPRRQIVPEDQARARSLLLRKSDLGSRWTTAQSRSSAHTTCRGYDQSDLTVTGEIGPRAWIWTSRLEFVMTLARVYRTVADADESWRRGTSRAAMRCSATETVRVSKVPGTRVLSLERIAFPQVAPRVAAYRMVLSLGKRAQRLTIWVVAVQRSRGQVVITFSTFAGKRSIDLVRLARVTAARLATTMRGA